MINNPVECRHEVTKGFKLFSIFGTLECPKCGRLFYYKNAKIIFAASIGVIVVFTVAVGFMIIIPLSSVSKTSIYLAPVIIAEIASLRAILRKVFLRIGKTVTIPTPEATQDLHHCDCSSDENCCDAEHK